MKEEYIKYLACPKCKGTLYISHIDVKIQDIIEKGQLSCSKCSSVFEIVRNIPRFVSNENYAKGFGFQWNKHAITQYDSYTGVNVSETRFFHETKWPRNMEGELILEAGCGSGRFTEQAAKTGAMVISMDYSNAVDANYAYNGHKKNVFIVQGDICAMPFKKSFFDKLFCFGVLQHTPDVEKAFMALPAYLKPGGKIVVDVYRKLRIFEKVFATKYLIRHITKNMEHVKLYNIIRNYIDSMWPLAKLINKLPYGYLINRILLIADYRGRYPLSEDMLKEWAILDSFDMLSPAYDSPQTVETVKEWFNRAGLINVEVCKGYNGIEGRGERP